MSLTAMAHGRVLTVDTTKCTRGEKDDTRAVRPRDGGLFPEMDLVLVDSWPCSGPAETLFSRQAMGPAAPGAQTATLQHLASTRDSVSQLSPSMKLNVGG
jgi:hypothetical protein